jgi:hypothetical protein
VKLLWDNYGIAVFWLGTNAAAKDKTTSSHQLLIVRVSFSLFSVIEITFLWNKGDCLLKSAKHYLFRCF